MTTLAITLVAIGVVLWIVGFILHATVAASLDFDTSGFRLVIGPILVMLGNIAFWIGAVILIVLGIIWIVGQFS